MTDFAGALGSGDVAAVEGEIEAIENAGLAQVLVYVAPSLPQGRMLEDITLCAANAWGVGDAERDDGIIVFVFMTDRKIRIEVGAGAEEAISSEAAARIIAGNMAPLFGQGRLRRGAPAGRRHLPRQNERRRETRARPSRAGRHVGSLLFWR